MTVTVRALPLAAVAVALYAPTPVAYLAVVLAVFDATTVARRQVG